MSGAYDVAVVGAGHNGLAAAALLAKRGRRVVVLERREAVGGLAAGEEFHPGYRSAGVLHETAAVRPWAAKLLGLAGHGLELRPEPPPVYVPERGGRGLLLFRDAEKAAAEIGARSPRDAGRYREYRAFLERVGPVFRRLLDAPPADLARPGAGELLRLAGTALRLRLLGREDMMEVLRVSPMCVADWLGEWFEDGLLRAALAGPAVWFGLTGPWSPGTNAALLLSEARAGAPVRGGAPALVAALERAARAYGAELRTGAEVERLEVANGRVSGLSLAGGERLEAACVAASCDPKHLFLDLLPPERLGRRLEKDIGDYRVRGTSAKIHLALAGYPEWSGRPGLTPERIRTGETIDEIERAFDAAKYRRCSERPVLDVHVPSLESPDLAPDGHHVLSILVHYAPYGLEGGWSDEAKERLYEAALGVLSEHAPGIRDLVVGREVLGPADLESRYGVTGGHLLHGEQSLDQLLIRPTPQCARYAAPVPGLYLCGSGSHPGGGLTCAPGALAARAILNG